MSFNIMSYFNLLADIQLDYHALSILTLVAFIVFIKTNNHSSFETNYNQFNIIKTNK